MLDATIKKGKGNKINKLRVIQTIDADLQLTMRIFLGSRIAENYENDDRMSNHDYGSRKGHSIESASLEERLMFDLPKKIEKPNAHTMSDLEVCYDRQLPNIGGILEDSVGANREAVN